MMQAARDALVDALLESGTDDAVEAVVPALLAGRSNVGVSLCRRLLRRGAPLTEFTATCIARLPSDALERFLEDHPDLPADVLRAVVAAHGRSSTMMKLVARRGDLDDTVAMKLAGRSSAAVVDVLRSNLSLPACAYWKVSRHVQRLGMQRSRYDGNQFARAWFVAKAMRNIGWLMCGTTPPPRAGFANRALADDVFRLLPVDQIDPDVYAGLVAYQPDADELATWVIHRPHGDITRLIVQLAAVLPESAATARLRARLSEPITVAATTMMTRLAKRVAAPGPAGGDEHRVWSDDTTVAAAWHAGGRWRQLALPSPALDPSLIWSTLKHTDDQVELAALALNPALDTAMIAALLTRLDPRRCFCLHAAALTDSQRHAILTGAGREAMAGVIAQGLGAADRPDWLAGWWTVGLARAALAAAGDNIDVASPIAEAMVASWPDTLDDALSCVTVHHRVGPVVVAALADRIGRLDQTGAAVVATMLGSWDGALADLVSVAALI